MKIVVALGGNALGNSPQEQFLLAKEAASSIVDLIKDGNQVIITHGNGPQVGIINEAFENLEKIRKNSNIPFPECGAMSQGYIGFHLQNTIRTEMLNRNIHNEVVSLITQVIVDINDEAFNNPTKPIGVYYTEDEARILEKKIGKKFIEDSGRGYRQVIASPKPIDIVEKNVILSLVSKGIIVIASGGGGIPVIEKGNDLIGVEAVIDKDFASAKLAKLIDADMLFLLTAVDRVMINYNKPNQKEIIKMNLKEAEKYIEENQFPSGSMLPKIRAAMEFVHSGENKQSIIGSLKLIKESLEGLSGTKIINEEDVIYE